MQKNHIDQDSKLLRATNVTALLTTHNSAARASSVASFVAAGYCLHHVTEAGHGVARGNSQVRATPTDNIEARSASNAAQRTYATQRSTPLLSVRSDCCVASFAFVPLVACVSACVLFERRQRQKSTQELCVARVALMEIRLYSHAGIQRSLRQALTDKYRAVLSVYAHSTFDRLLSHSINYQPYYENLYSPQMVVRAKKIITKNTYMRSTSLNSKSVIS